MSSSTERVKGRINASNCWMLTASLREQHCEAAVWAVLAGSPGLHHSQAGNENVQTEKRPSQTYSSCVSDSIAQSSTQRWWWSPVSFSENSRWSGHRTHLLQLFIYTVLLFRIFSGFFWQKKTPHKPPLSLGLLLGPALRGKTGAERAVTAVQRSNWK